MPLPPAHHRLFREAQLRFLLSQLPMAGGVTAAVALLFCVAMLETAKPAALAAWYAAVLAISTWQYAFAKRFERILDPKRVSARAIRDATWKSLIIASPWTVAILVFFPSDVPAHQMFLTFVVGGMMAGAVTTLAPLPTVTYAYLLPIAIPLVIRFLMEGERLQTIMGLMLVVYTAGILFAARIGFNRFCDLVRAQGELEDARLDLLDAIESTSEAFALFDASGRPVIRNRRHRDLFGAECAAPSPDAKLETIERHTDGRWLQSSIRRTARGGSVAIHADISGLKEREQELETARDRASAADRAKSEFLALMSHELRTPLNAILGFSQMIEKTVRPDAHPEYAGAIRESGEHLLAIINDILDLSKIEAGAFELNETPLALDEIVDSLLSKLSPLAHSKSVRLTADPASHWPRLVADERAVSQMLMNLLSNGLKFTDADGSVTLSCTTNAEEFVITVRDTGIGIAQDDLPQIFEPFRQVDRGLDRSGAGTGLGVPIVDRLARLHGGHLTFESAVGRGTAARLHFPADRLVVPGEAEAVPA